MKKRDEQKLRIISTLSEMKLINNGVMLKLIEYLEEDVKVLFSDINREIGMKDTELTVLRERDKNRAEKGFFGRWADRLTSKAFIKFKVRETLKSLSKWAHRYAKSKYII